MREAVIPNQLSANGLWNIFTGRKSYTIVCGGRFCGFTYADKVFFAHSDDAQSICPSCGALNRWSHAAWARQYERAMAC